ncbi:MAG: ribosome small subunit-dependent GTPase A [Bdellovibrionaceae bacterium]|nr:ribosome small subunit-dependent GTPase A [Bdellovibrionales bacterium]MCB9085251.1 ribosome small subunit-dependent GTPase A [Pseudobdellovibrionaceae bacterium]
MTINEFGWETFECFLEGMDRQLNFDPRTIGRVAQVQRDLFGVICEAGYLWCELTGKLRHEVENSVELPVVGDWVELSPPFTDAGGEWSALITGVLPRRSFLARGGHARGTQVLAANVDRVMVVMSANLDFKVNRLDRYMALAAAGNCDAALVLSKADLHPHMEELVSQVKARHPDLPVFVTSVVSQTGLKELAESLLPEKAYTFVGSSGVGKSSLVNFMMGREVLAVSGIREDDDKGRHTTTHREMVKLESGALLVDTPGLRAVGLVDEDEALEATFGQLHELGQRCKFRDCTHDTEPGCAVRAALESGELDPQTWESYDKLKREQAFELRKQDKAMAANHKKHWKTITQNWRVRKKHEGR